MSLGIVLKSTLTCPDCGHQEVEDMLADACQWFYECQGCGRLLQPRPGECCVFCSYGTVSCPPAQSSRAEMVDEASAEGGEQPASPL